MGEDPWCLICLFLFVLLGCLPTVPSLAELLECVLPHSPAHHFLQEAEATSFSSRVSFWVRDGPFPLFGLMDHLLLHCCEFSLFCPFMSNLHGSPQSTRRYNHLKVCCENVHSSFLLISCFFLLGQDVRE